MLARVNLSYPIHNSNQSVHFQNPRSKQGLLVRNLLLCFFSAIKMIIGIQILSRTDEYSPSIKIWLRISIIFDLINTLLLLAVIFLNGHYHQFDLTQSQGGYLEELEDQANHILNGKGFEILIILNNCFYYISLILCFYLWKNKCFGCIEISPATYSFICFNAYCGLLYSSLCLIYAIITKNFSIILTHSFIQRPSTATTENNSPINVRLYSTGMDSAECHICLLNYKEGDKLSELPCNSKHYFHEICIQRWFKVKNFCPLCRKRIAHSDFIGRKKEIEFRQIVP